MLTKATQIATKLLEQDAIPVGVSSFAVLNWIWLDAFNPIMQIAMTLGGGAYLYFKIQNARADWKIKRIEAKLKQRELDE